MGRIGTVTSRVGTLKSSDLARRFASKADALLTAKQSVDLARRTGSKSGVGPLRAKQSMGSLKTMKTTAKRAPLPAMKTMKAKSPIPMLPRKESSQETKDVPAKVAEPQRSPSPKKQTPTRTPKVAPKVAPAVAPAVALAGPTILASSGPASTTERFAGYPPVKKGGLPPCLNLLSSCCSSAATEYD